MSGGAGSAPSLEEQMAMLVNEDLSGGWQAGSRGSGDRHGQLGWHGMCKRHVGVACSEVRSQFGEPLTVR